MYVSMLYKLTLYRFLTLYLRQLVPFGFSDADCVKLLMLFERGIILFLLNL